MRFQKKISLLAVACALSTLGSFAFADKKAPAKATAEAVKPWMNTSLNADQRVDLLLKEMTLDEKLTLVYGYFGSDRGDKNYKRPQGSIVQSAGYIPGIPRLGIPEQQQTDAGLGVASQSGDTPRERTCLPAGTATAASWNADIAYQGGAMIGSEARASGFNIMLAGGVNLVREPRNGRNFEYFGEDPLLGGVLAGQAIKGIQSNNIISTLKHYAYNDQETNRGTLNVVIDEAAGRMSDLFALQIANEIGHPGSVMCSYNRVNGFYSCENEHLLTEVLKKDWNFKGYVMSDWGATHSTVQAANAGLDQDSASEVFNKSPYFGAALKEAVLNNWVPESRLNDMARRILWALIDKGAFDHPVSQDGPINFAANENVAQVGAEEGTVLLKNANSLLPLSKDVKKIAVIGGYSDRAVLAGGGSSRVYPRGGMFIKGLQPEWWPGPILYLPSSPLKSIQAQSPNSQVSFNAGTNVKEAAALAAQSDVVVLFAEQWIGEDNDADNLTLPNKLDDLIAAVAKANPKTVVVLETGSPVYMPWLNNVGAVLEAWYPGTRGAEAIARILFGEVNPSGHLPITFPASDKQLVRDVIGGKRGDNDFRYDVHYSEGAAVGYKWYDLKNFKPLFPFGYGLSYTDFSYSNITSEFKNGSLTVHLKVTNTGKVKGKAVPQLYVAPEKAIWEAPKRLVGWDKVELNPGESKDVSVRVEPRVLSNYDVPSKTWRILEGDYKIVVASHAMDEKAASAKVRFNAVSLAMDGKPLN